jgi:LPS O-antigen subunit length determinant protein (WzzB/FepE family)
MEEPGPELIDYLEICWKRKWLILIPTLFLVLAAAAISFVLPKVWEVSCVILPSKLLTLNEQGAYTEIVFTDAKQIVSQVSESSYNRMIADELKLDLKSIPKFTAANTKDTQLVLMSARNRDIEKSIRSFQSLIKFLKVELDAKAEIEIRAIEIKINEKDIEIKGLEQEISVAREKIDIISRRKREIDGEMIQARKRIESLENDQRQYLKAEKKAESESLAMLLYSNNIQLSLKYHDELNELLNSKKMEEATINIEIEKNTTKMKQLTNEMNSLKEKKGRIDFTQVVKQPSVSLEPVSPTKVTIILATAIISFFIFVFVAFALESFDRKKSLRA